MIRSLEPVHRLIATACLATGVMAAVTLGGPSARADPVKPLGTGTYNIAPISPLTVLAGGTEATVSFTTADPTTVTVDYKPAQGGAVVVTPTPTPTPKPTPKPAGTPFVPLGRGDLHRFYTTRHDLKLTGLKANTPYDVVVTAETQSGQRLGAQTRFTTAKLRIRVTLREINITEDGDGFLKGDGEHNWRVYLSWKGRKISGCYPNITGDCEYGSHSEGRIFPRNRNGQPFTWLFAAENFDALPDSFRIEADGDEYDPLPLCAFSADLCGHCIQTGVPGTWTLTLGPEYTSTPVSVNPCSNSENFRSTVTLTVETFHDNLSYPSERNNPISTW